MAVCPSPPLNPGLLVVFDTLHCSRAGAFVVSVKLPNVTLWDLSWTEKTESASRRSLNVIVRLYVNAFVVWHEGAKGPQRALHE